MTFDPAVEQNFRRVRDSLGLPSFVKVSLVEHAVPLNLMTVEIRTNVGGEVQSREHTFSCSPAQVSAADLLRVIFEHWRQRLSEKVFIRHSESRTNTWNVGDNLLREPHILKSPRLEDR